MKKAIAVIFLLFIIAPYLLIAAEYRKVGNEDIQYGPSNSTWTSSGGTVSHYVPYPFAGSTNDNAAVIDVRAYGAVGDGTTDDTAAIQAALNYTGTYGVTIYIPRGYKFRVTDYLYCTSDNVVVTGGGELYFDASSFSAPTNLTGPTASGGRFALIFSKTDSTLPTPVSDPEYPTGAGSDVNNVLVENITISSTGSYAGSQNSNHQGITFWRVKNAILRNVTITGFNGEAVNFLGVNKGVINGNIIYNCAFNGLSSYASSDITVTSNVLYQVGQGMELNGLRVTVTGNVVTDVKENGIWIAVSTLRENMRAVVANNIVKHDTSESAGYNGIRMSTYASTDAATAFVKQYMISGNTIYGNFVNGIYTNTPTLDGSVSIKGNSISLTGDTTNAGQGISVELATGVTQASTSAVDIVENVLAFDGTHEYAIEVIYFGSSPKTVISNNVITSSSEFSGTYTQIYNVDKAIIANTLDNNVYVGTNYYNGRIIGFNMNYDTSTDNVLDSMGRAAVTFTPGAATDIVEVRGYIGQYLTVFCGNGNTTFIHSATLRLVGSTDYACPANGSLTVAIVGLQGADSTKFNAVEVGRSP